MITNFFKRKEIARDSPAKSSKKLAVASVSDAAAGADMDAVTVCADDDADVVEVVSVRPAAAARKETAVLSPPRAVIDGVASIPRDISGRPRVFE